MTTQTMPKTLHTKGFTIPPFREPLKAQVKEINYIRILLEVVAISGLVLGACWALAVSKGNEVWASKTETDSALENLNKHMDTVRIITSHHISHQDANAKFVTRDELRDMKSDFNDFAKEQRSVNREILQRLPK